MEYCFHSSASRSTHCIGVIHFPRLYQTIKQSYLCGKKIDIVGTENKWLNALPTAWQGWRFCPLASAWVSTSTSDSQVQNTEINLCICVKKEWCLVGNLKGMLHKKIIFLGEQGVIYWRLTSVFLCHRPFIEIMTYTFYSERNLLWRKQVHTKHVPDFLNPTCTFKPWRQCIEGNALLKVKTLLCHLTGNPPENILI